MASYYISTTGNDSTGDGTQALPWLTISKAHDSAAGGDTIICLDGTYTWVSQTFTKSLTITAQNKGLATFNGAGADVIWVQNAAVRLDLTNLIFTNSIATTRNFTSISSTGTSGIYFESCIFHNLESISQIDQGGIFSGGTYSNAKFSLNLCALYDIRCTDNTDGNGWAGLFTGRQTEVYISNTTFHLSGINETYFKWIFTSQGSIYNLLDIVNTIIYKEGTEMPAIKGGTNQGGNPVSITYSCLYGITDTSQLGEGGVVGDPKFIDPDNADFSLAPDSPAIGAGTLL